MNLRQSVSRILAYLSLNNILGLKTEKESYNSSFAIELSKFKSTWTRLDSNCNIEFILIENVFFSFVGRNFILRSFHRPSTEPVIVFPMSTAKDLVSNFLGIFSQLEIVLFLKLG